MSREDPIFGGDFRAGCRRANCPCQLPGNPCPEFMGGDEFAGEEGAYDRWCPRCGWHRKHHPGYSAPAEDVAS